MVDKKRLEEGCEKGRERELTRLVELMEEEDVPEREEREEWSNGGREEEVTDGEQ